MGGMPTPALDEKLLGRTTLFHGVSLESVRGLLDQATVRDLVDGEVLLDPARPNDALHLVLDGCLRIHLGSVEEPPHSHVEPGACVGEVSLIDGLNPSALVVSDGRTSVLSLSNDLLWALVGTSHGVARNLLQILSGRLRHNNRAILEGLARQKLFERHASVDALTGLHNRRWLDEMFDRQTKRSLRDAKTVAIVMIDIDRFKSFNDRFGHLAGDAVLGAVGQTLLNGLRPNDLIARYGGEEFAALLPDTSATDACRAAERLRTAVERLSLRTAEGEPLPEVTISLGVAGLVGAETYVAVIAAADAALLRAKEGGRNRWVLAARHGG